MDEGLCHLIVMSDSESLLNGHSNSYINPPCFLFHIVPRFQIEISQNDFPSIFLSHCL